MIWNIHYTDDVERDLQDIYDYIANNLREPITAERQISRITKAAKSLERLPFRYRLCDYEPQRSRGWRVMPVDNYLIFYMPDESKGSVEIMRVIYGSRDMGKHLD